MQDGYGSSVLVGRTEECERLEALLDSARDGRSGALLILGDPGLGKTSLLEHLIGQATGLRVLQARGSEYETQLPFAALHGLLRPLFSLIERIPATQARSLRAALALEGGEADRLSAYAGTLSLLAEAAEARPTLVLVDDVQWVDGASAGALLFAARRIAGEALALVFAGRLGQSQAFEASDLPFLELEGLDAESARVLLHSREGSALAPEAERHVLEAAAGNPLALVELPATLTEEYAGATALSGPLPLTERIQQAFLSSARVLPTDTQRVLLVAAATEDGEWGAVRRAAELLGADAATIADAEAARLVSLTDGSLRFRHPLVRSAIYQAAVPAERRAAHRALGKALEADPDRSAWHLAAAAEGPDETIAVALEETAERARSRGGFASQARALERAADLSPTSEARFRRLHAASAAAYWAGEPDHAIRLAESALPLAADPLLRADVRHRLSVIADWHGRWRASAIPSDELVREADRLEPLDPRRAAALLGVVLQRRFQALETEGALQLAERRVSLCAPAGGERHLRALQDLARAQGLRGNARETADTIDRVLAESPDEALSFATNIAEPLIWLERYQLARRLLTASVAEARTEGNIVRLIFEQTNLALLELRTGRLAPAVAGASEALSLAEQTGNEYIEACNLTTLACVDAIRGNEADCRRRAERAVLLARALGDELVQAEARAALGGLALGAGRPEEATRQLQPLAELARRNAVGEPGVLPYGPDLFEAYLRVGDLDGAERTLGELRERAEATDRKWALAAAERCSGLVASDDQIDARFGAAVDLHQGSGFSPFERARTELCYAERLRRAGRRVDARVQLRSALEVFDDFGARRWLERAEAELRATGETWRKRDPTAEEQLTPQELQIALQVAEGKTNREVGGALFLSPKTIEFHLTRTYRKLDIHSRAELIRLFAGQAEGGLRPAGPRLGRRPAS